MLPSVIAAFHRRFAAAGRRISRPQAHRRASDLCSPTASSNNTDYERWSQVSVTCGNLEKLIIPHLLHLQQSPTSNQGFFCDEFGSCQKILNTDCTDLYLSKKRGLWLAQCRNQVEYAWDTHTEYMFWNNITHRLPTSTLQQKCSYVRTLVCSKHNEKYSTFSSESTES